jgi:hypothetical protein
MTKEPTNVFFSYAHEDEPLRNELAKHLKLLERQGIIQSWHDSNISAGEEWKNAIDSHLELAQIILLLISSDFLASDYCYDVEMKRALERHEQGEVIVIPIILRAVSWYNTPLGKLQALPTDGRPILEWDDPDQAYTDIVKGICRTIEATSSGVSKPPVNMSKTPEVSKTMLSQYQENRDNSTGIQLHMNGGTVNINTPSQREVVHLGGIHTEAATLFKQHSKLDRLALIQMLNALPAAQFDELIFALHPPNGNIPGSDASQSKRSVGLLEWIESPIGPGLTALENILNQIVRHAAG